MNARWRGPAEGWGSLVLLAFLAFLLGFAVDDAKWVLGRDRLTDFLPAAAILGTLAGFITAELGWGRLRAHLATAVAAALIVPTLVGSALEPEQGDIFTLYRATAESSLQAFTDLVVHGRGSTLQYGHYMLLLGIGMWATGHFAAYAVYRHHRPFSAVIALGLALVVNMSLTLTDQLGILVLFSIGALLLLVGLHAFDERREWLRRRIGDPSPLAALTLRGGTVFVAAAVFGSLVLTSTASSAPLRDAWIGAEPTLVDIGRALQGWFPFIRPPRGPAGVNFGTTSDIGALWTQSNDVAVVIHRPPGDGTKYYWRASTYDQFAGFAWHATFQVNQPQAPGQDLLSGSAEKGTTSLGGRRKVTVTVDPAGYKGPQLLSPSTPVSATLPTTVSLIGKGGMLGAITTTQGSLEYEVSALYRTTGDSDPKSITANKLRVAGTEYPSFLSPYLQRYALGPSSQQLLDYIGTQLPPGATDPYDWAKATVDVLTSDMFHYSPDVTGVDCTNLSAVECFARFKRGFCQYYASTMAVLLRDKGIPTRLVQGFLPGEMDPTGTTETVRFSSSHAWVEVWFPGYGWVDFDPTGGHISQLGQIEIGQPVAKPSPPPSASRTPQDSGDTAEASRRTGSLPPNGAGTATGGGLGSGPFILIAIVLLAAMGWLALASYRRGPREVTADGAWTSVTGLARRLGFGPRPTQTVYEYSNALGDLLPGVRPELETVARAKVEVAYGHHDLGQDRIRALRAATGRLRVGLLRLLFRRPRRRR